MIPSCFSHPSNTLSSASQVPQNLITCIYQTHDLFINTPTYLTLTWSRTPSSHSLTIYASQYSFSFTISLFPPTFSSFFRNNRHGSKSFYLPHHQSQRLKLYWDFTRAEFTHDSAEPDSGFYLAVSCNTRLGFFLGDLQAELTRRSGLAVTREVPEPGLLCRREHVFGSGRYVFTGSFLGSRHEIVVDCNGGALILKIDGKTSLVIKRLAWKFRGNERVLVGGIEMEFFWDVLNLVNNNNNNNISDDKGTNNGSNRSPNHGVFIFQVGDGGVWPEMVGPEKKLMRKSSSWSSPAASWPSPSCSSVLKWAEESSDCGRSSSCSSTSTTTTTTSRSFGSNVGGFSLFLYAWRRDSCT